MIHPILAYRARKLQRHVLRQFAEYIMAAPPDRYDIPDTDITLFTTPPTITVELPPDPSDPQAQEA